MAKTVLEFARTKKRKPAPRGKRLNQRLRVQLSTTEKRDIGRAADRRKKPDTEVLVTVRIPGGRKLSRSAFMAQASIAIAQGILGADSDESLHAASPDKAAHHRSAGADASQLI